MAGCGEYIKSEFPLIDDDLYLYVEGVYSYCELQQETKGPCIFKSILPVIITKHAQLFICCFSTCRRILQFFKSGNLL